MAEFIHGLDLCGLFYSETVQPVLDADFPGLRYSAALIGPGSDVLGFDTEQSTDHFWGPRLILFLSRDDHSRFAEAIKEALRHRLPVRIHGYSTHHIPIPGETVTWRQDIESGPVNHLVFVYTIESMLMDWVGVDHDRPFTVVDWLTIPSQIFLSVMAAGRVYHDGLGTLEPLRARFAFYPHDVWLYLLAAGWQRLSEEEPFMGRNGQVGDELGSSVIVSRLVHDVMALCFLMERQYAPYSKWFGSGFARLHCAPQLTPLLQRSILSADRSAKSICRQPIRSWRRCTTRSTSPFLCRWRSRTFTSAPSW
ncbi:MAG TPA: DUF4037 domain-containing protein [Aggregatilineales bacterium]|nr:DUF4037 domain-containing protein [Aggregatilineales bacterium]